MNDFNLNVNLDYSNKKISAGLVINQPNYTGFPTPLKFRLLDEKGLILSICDLNYSSGHPSMTSYIGETDFGVSPITKGGYDSSIYRTDLSGLYSTETTTMWEMSKAIPLIESFIRPIELATIGNIYNPIDFRKDIYKNVPVLITEGDAVLQGTVATVTNKNVITISVDKSLAAYSGYNLSNSYIKVISGSASGNISYVTNQSLSSLTVDSDYSSLSGQLVKIMPHRTISSYSGFSYYGTGTNSGDNGIKARFGLSSNIPAKVGSIEYNSGYYSGTTFIDHPFFPGYVAFTAGTDGYVAGVVGLKNDTYQRKISYGDLLFYNPASSPSSIFTGVILEVGSHAVAGQGDFHIKYWPGVAAATGSIYRIFRANSFELQTYPSFGADYLGVATSYAGNTGSWIKEISCPTVSLDFTANEQESTYAGISETSHFLVGPIKLSNGKVLQDMATGNQNPALKFNITVQNGPASSPVTIKSISCSSTQNPNIGQNYAGSYYQSGVLTFTADTSFVASETLRANCTINYGSCTLDNVFVVPVQPAI